MITLHIVPLKFKYIVHLPTLHVHVPLVCVYCYKCLYDGSKLQCTLLPFLVLEYLFASVLAIHVLQFCLLCTLLHSLINSCGYSQWTRDTSEMCDSVSWNWARGQWGKLWVYNFFVYTYMCGVICSWHFISNMIVPIYSLTRTSNNGWIRKLCEWIYIN